MKKKFNMHDAQKKFFESEPKEQFYIVGSPQRTDIRLLKFLMGDVSTGEYLGTVLQVRPAYVIRLPPDTLKGKEWA